MKRVKSPFQWLLAFCIAFCFVNLLCFLYERPTGWFDTPNGVSPAGWRPGSVIVHGMEGYGVTRVDRNGYLNPEGELAEGYILMMGSSHTQGKEIPSHRKYSVLVNNYFAKDTGKLYTYNISCDGNFLPSQIKHFPAAIAAFPDAGMVTLEIASTDFSESQIESALDPAVYDPQNTIAIQAAHMGTMTRLKNGIKEYFPLLSLIRKKIETKAEADSHVAPEERNPETYSVLLGMAMEQLRSHYDGKIVFIYHPDLEIQNDGTVRAVYSETWELFCEACREYNIDVMDMGPAFLAHYAHSNQLPYGFANTVPGAGHLNQVGHHLIAEGLIAMMEEVA